MLREYFEEYGYTLDARERLSGYIESLDYNDLDGYIIAQDMYFEGHPVNSWYITIGKVSEEEAKDCFVNFISEAYTHEYLLELIKQELKNN